MSLLEQLNKKKGSLKITKTVVTKGDGRRFVETTDGCVEQEISQKQFGFVVDNKPDNIPAEILKYLYLGSQDCCELNVLRAYNIRTVLSVGIEPPCTYEGIKYKFVKCLDLPETNIIDVIQHQCNNFIKETIGQQENILIHCNAGVSRSSAVIIGFLMLHKNIAYDEAYSIVKSKRPCIKPNVGFEQQLKCF